MNPTDSLTFAGAGTPLDAAARARAYGVRGQHEVRGRAFPAQTPVGRRSRMGRRSATAARRLRRLHHEQRGGRQLNAVEPRRRSSRGR